jgi:hypothetical protein
MQPRIKIGLIFGAVGLVLNTCFSAFMVVCGPVIALIMGGVAGYLAAQQEKSTAKNEAARIGATAGGVAGGLNILGMIVGSVGALAFVQITGVRLPFGQVPPASSDPASQINLYTSNIGTALCFGIVGALFAAGAGALIAYFTTPDRPAALPPSQDIIS